MARRPGVKAKKITVDIPRSLYEEAERIVHEQQTTTSVFVCSAMEHYLKSIKRKNLERQLAEGYIANNALSDRIYKEFEFADADLP